MAGKRGCLNAARHALLLKSFDHLVVVDALALTTVDSAAYYLYIQNISSKAIPVALNIKDPVTEKFVRELAAVAGESVTTAVRRAAEERLQRVRRQQAGRSLAVEILEIGKRCAALPDLDVRSADEILGYDEHGLPR
jgi:antitoxin VapB